MVTVTVECPNNCCTVARSAPCSNKRVVKVWRKLCHVIPSIPAFRHAKASPAAHINGVSVGAIPSSAGGLSIFQKSIWKNSAQFSPELLLA